MHEPHYDQLARPMLAEVDNLRAAMSWVAAVGTGSVADAPLAEAEALEDPH